MTLKLIEAPAVEPVSLAEAKLHLRVDIDDDDTLIEALIVAAREHAEHLTGRALITQTWRRVLPGFPCSGGAIELGMPPVGAIEQITYVDTDGALQTLADTLYALDGTTVRGSVYSVDGAAWPATSRVLPDAVKVQFVAGYGAAGTDVPSAIRQWLLLNIGAGYRNREAFAAGVSVAELPNRFTDALLDRYRAWWL